MIVPHPPLFHPQFLELGGPPLGRRFAIHHPPAGPMVGSVVYVHPLAEEMNKSRRMAALQSRALARRGFAVLQIDLLGCGDSDGDFADATWQQWIDDVVHSVRWLQQHHHAAPTPCWLWGLRAGCLIALEAADRLPGPCHFLLWQPPPSGKVLLQQFLRLGAASELMAGQAKAAMEQLRGRIAAGREVEIAGYTLSAELAKGLEQATLRPRTPPGRMVWLETTAAEQPALSPAARSTLQAWQSAGWIVDAQCVGGAAFWQTAEIEDAPALIEASTAALASAGHHADAPGSAPVAAERTPAA